MDVGPVTNALFQAISIYLHAGTLEERVERLNTIRRHIADQSPFTSEPVDLVEWVPSDTVTANDYNPNQVAPPEMELLRLSIMADGYTQPVVTLAEGEGRVVVDGFHRRRVGRECDDVRDRVHAVHLMLDRGLPYRTISARAHVSLQTVARWKKQR